MRLVFILAGVLSRRWESQLCLSLQRLSDNKESFNESLPTEGAGGGSGRNHTRSLSQEKAPIFWC